MRRSMDTPFLTTKLHIPHLRPNLVPRRRLTERLDQALRLGHRLLLVCAPAGFGKTTLLSEWVHGGGRPVAWVSLDENDNDPVTFWTHVVAALRAGLPNTQETTLGEGLLTVLQSPASAHEGASASMDTLLATLLNEMAELSVTLITILDDYHLIETQSIHDALSFLLEHLPPQMHLVISSRIDPPLPLARLRGRYQLTEIREADLRFTRVETVAFLNEAMGLGLAEDNMAALASSTEGWIVGLQLAALSLKGKDAARIEAFVQSFGGSHRHIIDYLVEEVLQQQTDEIRDFLLQTGILDRLTAPLCDAVTGRDDSRVRLAQLEQANLFLVPLDEWREWYRYHHLFADFLRVQAKLQPQALAALHQKAARWYEANGFMTEAIKHALAGGDMVDAARLIGLVAVDTLRHARFATFFKWLDALPDEFVRADADLATTKGYALLQAGDLAAAESYVQAAAKSLPVDAPQPARAKVIALQAQLPLFRGSRHDDRIDAIQQAREALELIGDTNPLFRGTLLTHLGETQRAHGDLKSAAHTFREAVNLNRGIGNHVMAIIAMSNLALMLHQQGRRREAAALCQEVISQHVDTRGRPIAPAGVAHILLATMHYEANDLAQAHHHLHKGLALNEHMVLFTVTLMGKTLLAQLQQATGETQAGLATIRETCQPITEENARRWSVLAARATEANLLLKQGNLTAVAHWAHSAGLSPTDTPSYVRMPMHLAYARLLLAQNRPEEAQTLLTRLERAAQNERLHGTLITIHALQALTQQALGEEDRALTCLRRALLLAAPENYYRSLLDEGLPLAVLLFKVQAHLGESVDPVFVRNLLEAFRAELEHAPAQPALLVEPLTERELEVLQLIVDGLSNREIAAELYLAIGTVKKHITNIYGKLGVQRRAQAIARTRELALL
jgi:LuxR family maltose regulon positive regulatory protein